MFGALMSPRAEPPAAETASARPPAARRPRVVGCLERARERAPWPRGSSSSSRTACRCPSARASTDGHRAQFGRPGQRRQPHPESPRRPLDRLARPRSARGGRGSGGPARGGAGEARVRHRGPPRRPRAPVLRGLRQPDVVAPLPQLRHQLRSGPRGLDRLRHREPPFRDAVLEHLEPATRCGSTTTT